ncbi:MAG: hypothetical protein AAF927_28765 [Bacteroidota bacterium]
MKNRIVFLGLIGLCLSFSSLSAQSPILLYEAMPSQELQRYYQQRGVKSYTLTNYRVYKGDTLTRGVYKLMQFDPFGRIIYDSTATAMGRQFRYNYNAQGQLDRISKRNMKGDGYTLVENDSLGRKIKEVEISHRLDTNEVRTYFYDANNRLSRKVATNLATTAETTYTYDESGHLTQSLTTTQTIKGEVKTGTIYRRDARGNIVGLRELKDGNVRQVDDYLYNDYGQIVERRLPGKGEYYRYYYNHLSLLIRVEVYDINRRNLKGWQVYDYTFH